MRNPPAFVHARKEVSKDVLGGVIVYVSLVAWLPRQEFAYISPFLVFSFWFTYITLLDCGGLFLSRLLFWLVAFCCLFALAATYGLLNGLSILHPLMWLLTHGVLLMVVIGYRLSHSKALWGTALFIKANLFIGLAEVLVAWLQYAGSPGFRQSLAAGDYIVGTLGKNSHLFSMKMLVLFFISLYTWKFFRKKGYLLLSLIFLETWLLGSALHTVMVMFGALGLYWFIFTSGAIKKLKLILAISVLSGATIGVLLYQQGKNINYIVSMLSYAKTGIHDVPLGKIDAYYRTLLEVPSNEGLRVILFGFGPGGYASRASWLLSGSYLENQSYIPVVPSDPWEAYLQDLWNPTIVRQFVWRQGVANQPFSTWLSILGEFGIVGLGLFIWLLTRVLIRYHRAAANHPNDPTAKISIMIILLMAFSFLFDNWLEYPRLMMPIELFLTLTYQIVHP